MTNQEMSNAMDVMLNSFAYSAEFGKQASNTTVVLDEYEKSYFLTKAQEELVIALYAGESIEGESYEETERLRRMLSSLNATAEYEPSGCADYIGIDSQSTFFDLDSDILFITYEAVRTDADPCLSGKNIEVIPVRQDWFHRQVRNPFRGATKKRALRLDMNDTVAEIVYPLTISKYYIRYVRKPRPIVLTNLSSEDLSINEENHSSSCELPEILHQKIVDRAVMLALRSKGMIQTQNNNN